MSKKRILLLAVVITTAIITANAQQPICGSVTDQHGAGLPGAKVEILGTGITAETNLDGKFLSASSLNSNNKKSYKLRVSAIGKVPVTRHYTSGMNIKLRPLTWWTEKPQRWHFFAGVEVASNSDGLMPVGVRLATAKQFGFYAHIAMTSIPQSMGEQSATDYVAVGSHYKKSTMLFGGGAMVRLGYPIYLYAGATMRNDRFFVEHLDNYPDGTRDGWIEATGDFLKMHYENDYIYNGIMPEAGVMLNVNRFYVNAGAMIGNDDVMLSLGGGLKF